MRVGIIGAGGYVGTSLLKSFSCSKNYEVEAISRDSNLVDLETEMEIVIHSANPATRYKANANPLLDYQETVLKTESLLNSFKSQKFILISTISCRTQLETSYGQNRRDCELKVLEKGGSILRLGPMFGGTRVKDVIHDIVRNEKIYVSSDTQYAYADVSWVTNYIMQNLQKFEGITEIGANNTIKLSEVASSIKSTSEFFGPNDDQYPVGFKDGPDAKLVLEYARAIQNHELTRFI
jgi:nucleoside-diphosphate-sugar epimerase